MKKIFFLFAILFALFIAAPIAFAHANLVRSEPAANSAQKIAPARVRMWFSEEIETSFSTASVLNQAGAVMDLNDAHRLSDDPKAMEVSLKNLAEGWYTVSWRALSAVDGHATNGSFVFTVGDAPLASTSTRETMGLVDAALAASAPPSWDQVIARWLNVVVLSLLIGALAFPILILLPARSVTQDGKSLLRVYRDYIAQPRADRDPALEVWGVRWMRVTRVLFVLYVLATVWMLIAQAHIAGDGIAAIPRVLSATRFGTIWFLRMVMLGFLANELFRSKWEWTRGAHSNQSLLLSSTLGVLILIMQSLNSHGAAISDPPILALVIDAIHLLGVAIWVGGLVQLLITIPVLLRALPESARAPMLAAVVACFSFVVFIVVGVVALTGMYSMIVQVGSLEAFFSTLYGETLFIKISLIAPLLALGAFNLIVNRPALARARAFRFDLIVAIEIAFAFATLFAVGVMTSVAPAQSVFKPIAPLWIESRQVDDVQITLGIAPGLVGTNDLDLKLQDRDGHAIVDATVVRFIADMRAMEMGPQEITMTNLGEGHYTARAGVLSMVGNWEVETLVRRAGHDDARTTFIFPAQLQRTPEPAQPLLAATQVQLALGLIVFAFFAGTIGVLLIPERRGRITNLIGAIAVSVIAFIALRQFVADSPPPQIIIIPVAPASARSLRSPVRADPTQLAAGQQIYAQNCMACHGALGKGDGPAAAPLNPKPFDLTVHAALHTEGELYWWVTYGISGTAMVSWETPLNDLQRWQVVTYVRSLGANATPTPPR